MGFEHQNFTVIGARLTRDPEERKNFGKRSVIRFGIAFTGERRKDDNDQWKDFPVFMDCEAWQGEYGPKLVDVIEKYGKKGLRVSVIGTLKMEEWEDKNHGGKRRAIKLNVKEFIILDKVETGGSRGRDDDGDSHHGNKGRDSGSGGYGGYGGGDSEPDPNDPIPF